MGRTRKPVSEQKGHLRVIDMQKRLAEEEMAASGKAPLRTPPDAMFFDENAKKEWKRSVKLLKEQKLFGDLDRNNLLCYCNAFAQYLKATQDLKESGTFTTADGKKHPLVLVQKDFLAEAKTYAALCGLTMDSRLKAAAKKTDAVETQIKKKCGGI